MSNRTGKRCELRLELVRQLGHPSGDPGTCYELVLPLNPDSHIDATSWLDNPSSCVVRRRRPGQPDRVGRLARNQHGRWYFDYANDGGAEGDQGIRLGDDRFALGALVGINEDDGKTRTFRVVSVTR